jgi:hypothetical protein
MQIMDILGEMGGLQSVARRDLRRCSISMATAIRSTTF